MCHWKMLIQVNYTAHSSISPNFATRKLYDIWICNLGVLVLAGAIAPGCSHALISVMIPQLYSYIISGGFNCNSVK